MPVQTEIGRMRHTGNGGKARQSRIARFTIHFKTETTTETTTESGVGELVLPD